MKNKKQHNNLYKIIAIIGFILLFLLICYFLLFNKKDNVTYKLTFEHDKINSFLDKYKDYEIELTRTVDDVLYGMIYDSSKNGDLFITIGEFTYDYKSNSFEFYENKENTRIVDFYKYNDKIFKVSLEYYDKDSNYYNWKIIVEDSKKETTLLSGIINNIFMYPLIIVDNDNCYVATLVQNGNGNEDFILYELKEKKINEIYTQKSFSNSKNDRKIYDIANMKIINNHFLYTYMDSESFQYLIDYDLNSKKEEIIYSNNDVNYSIYSYLYGNDYNYLQLVNKNEKNLAKILILNNTENLILESKIFTFESIINGNILSHNTNNIWNLFNPKENINYDIQLTNSVDCYPKYLKITEKIIILGYDNNIYSSYLESDND